MSCALPAYAPLQVAATVVALLERIAPKVISRGNISKFALYTAVGAMDITAANSERSSPTLGIPVLSVTDVVTRVAIGMG